MPAVNQVLFNILCKDLEESAHFYRSLGGFVTVSETEWAVVLSPVGQPEVQIALLDQVSEFTPRHAWGQHEGTFLTFAVDDVFAAIRAAEALGVEVIEAPKAMPYGITRALIRDLNALVIEFTTPTEALAGTGEAEFVPVDRPTRWTSSSPKTAMARRRFSGSGPTSSGRERRTEREYLVYRGMVTSE